MGVSSPVQLITLTHLLLHIPKPVRLTTRRQYLPTSQTLNPTIYCAGPLQMASPMCLSRMRQRSGTDTLHSWRHSRIQAPSFSSCQSSISCHACLWAPSRLSCPTFQQGQQSGYAALLQFSLVLLER